jgi:hypothetical protein
MAPLGDQKRAHRVGHRVGDFVDDVGAAGEADHAGLRRRPQVLEVAVHRVEMAGDKGVKVAREVSDRAARIRSYLVAVVAEKCGRVKQELVVLDIDGEEVKKDLVGPRARAQEQLPAAGAPGDEERVALVDGPCSGHAARPRKQQASASASKSHHRVAGLRPDSPGRR